MRHDKKRIAKELKILDGGEEKSTIYVYSEDGSIIVVSYVDKKKSERKNTVLLTTMRDDVLVTKDERCKPDSLALYHHTKGGANVADLVSTNNTTRINHKRWPMNALAFVLDTVRTNAKTILQEPVS